MYWDSVGAHQIYAKLFENLNCGEKLSVLNGLSGTGKSWLLKTIGLRWEASGGITFYFEGMASSYLTPYSVLHTGVNTFEKMNQFRQALPKALGMSIDSLFKTRGVFAEIFSFINLKVFNSITNYCPAYDIDSTSILESIDIKSGNKPILIIADAIHLWDANSLALLMRIIESTPKDYNVKVIISTTEEQKHHIDELNKVVQSLVSMSSCVFNMPFIDDENYREAFKTLGLNAKISADVFDSLYVICGCHLPTICKGIEVINSHGESLDLTKTEDLYRSLIKEKNSTEDNNKLLTTLKHAALIGQSFHKIEIKCAINESESEIFKTLELARKMGFVSIENEICFFIHESFYYYFKEQAITSNAMEIYEKLDKCFAVLRASEFMTRAIISYKSHNYLKAACLILIHVSEECRKFGVKSLYDFDFLYSEHIFDGEMVIQVIKNQNIFNALICIVDFWGCFRENDFIAAQQNIELMETHGILLLEAEKDYCLTSLFLSTRDVESRETGKYLLNRFEGLKELEPYLWTKLNFNRLYIRSLENDRVGAEKIARDLENHLISRITFDQSARDELHILFRLSFAYYPKQLAEIRSKEALSYFSKQYKLGNCKRVDEYFRSLNNQATVEIKKRNWNKAISLLDEGERLYERALKNKIANPEFIFSNKYIANIRSGNIPAQNVAKLFNLLLPKNIKSLNSLVLANIISCNLIAENYEKAKELLDETREQWNNVEIEPFIYYMFKSSDILVSFLSGSLTEAKESWIKLETIVTKIPYSSQKYYLKRHNLLLEAFDDLKDCSLSKFDRYLIDVKKLDESELPNHYCHGIFLTNILYWRHG